MGTLVVRHERGDRYNIDVRGHHLVVDQPIADGGEDTAPTPTELFVAGLTSCVAFYVGRYLVRHKIRADGLAVFARYTMASNPARIDTVELDVVVPAGVPAQRREALLAVASHCTVHNTLDDPPRVTINLADDDAKGMPAPLPSRRSA